MTISGSSSLYGAPNLTAMQQMRFKKTDTDNDGKITKDELTSFLKKLDESSSSDKADEIFSTTDSDGDGTISQSELEEYLKANQPPPSEFSGSQSYNQNGQGQNPDSSTSSLFTATA